jgi:cytochrome c oxidase subunit 2
MRITGLTMFLVAGLALAGSAQAQNETAPPAAAPVAAAPAAAAPAPVAAAAAAPAATTDAAKPADPTLNPDGSHKTAPVPGIGMPVDGFIGIQPQVTKNGKDAEHFHNVILLPLITVISIFVLILLFWVIFRYRAKANPVPSKTAHNTAIEVIWTLLPVLILVAIAIPSIKLLAAQFKPAPDNAVTLKAIGNQWFWSYEYPDNGGVSIIANMLKEKGDPSIAAGARYRTDTDGPKLLAADNRVILPVNTPIRLITTAQDVIHSWAVPAFWIKLDAVPGKLNETSFTIDKEGVYFGQCSELCGQRHGYMPITVEVVSKEVFAQWIRSKGGTMPEDAAAAAAATANASAPATGNTAEPATTNQAEPANAVADNAAGN